ncbi:hypothetical protein ISCGN_025770 [Ixodes scapularis]
MPTSCVVFGCKRRARRGTGIGFFRFPAEGRDRSRRQAWIDAVGRPNVDGVPWEPSEASRVCGLHFVTGAPSLSPRQVDHVPTVFKDVHFGRRRRILPKFDEQLGYNLVGPDGSPWRPSSNSRVCSDHFLGLRRVDVQRHPDYLPSVFPDDYSHRSQRFSRCDRSLHSCRPKSLSA